MYFAATVDRRFHDAIDEYLDSLRAVDRERIEALAIPHWITADVGAAILKISVEDAEQEIGEFRQRVCFHEERGVGLRISSEFRHRILERLVRSNPERYRNISERAAAYFANAWRKVSRSRSRVLANRRRLEYRVEAIYHQLAFDPDFAAKRLNELLIYLSLHERSVEAEFAISVVSEQLLRSRPGRVAELWAWYWRARLSDNNDDLRSLKHSLDEELGVSSASMLTALAAVVENAFSRVQPQPESKWTAYLRAREHLDRAKGPGRRHAEAIMLSDSRFPVVASRTSPAEWAKLGFNLPSAHYEFFVGRERELGDLATWFNSDTDVAVVHGLGGIGKTALVFQFARKALDCHLAENVLWASAKTHNYIAGDIRTLTIDPIQRQVVFPAHQVLPVHGSTSSNLIIIDDAESLAGQVKLGSVVRDYCTAGKVLLTSRVRPLDLPEAQIITLGGLHADEGAAVALNASGRNAQRTLPQVAEIVRGLSGHPLIIADVAAHFEEMGRAGVKDLLLTRKPLLHYIYADLLAGLSGDALALLRMIAVMLRRRRRPFEVARTAAIDSAVSELRRAALVDDVVGDSPHKFVLHVNNVTSVYVENFAGGSAMRQE